MVWGAAVGAGLAAIGLGGAAASGTLKKSKQVEQAKPNPLGYTYGGEEGYYKEQRERLAEQEAKALTRAAPTLDFGNAAADRQQQIGLTQQYNKIISGNGQSVAEQQLRAGRVANAQQMSALAAGARGGGGNAILAQREAQRQGALSALATNRDAALLRAQEQATAMSGASQLSSAMAQQSMQQQGLISQNELAQRSMNDQRSLAMNQASARMTEAKLQGAMAFEQAMQGGSQWAQGTNAGIQAQDKNRQAQFYGSLISGGGQMMGMGAMGGFGGGK
jgi:hypothetical protein